MGKKPRPNPLLEQNKQTEQDKQRELREHQQYLVDMAKKVETEPEETKEAEPEKTKEAEPEKTKEVKPEKTKLTLWMTEDDIVTIKKLAIDCRKSVSGLLHEWINEKTTT